MSTSEHGADRRTFIGGSDVAAIIGLSPWASPYSVWAEKVGLVTPEHSDSHQERLDIGKDAERFLADVFNRHHVASPSLYVEMGQVDLPTVDLWPWLRGHADGTVEDSDGFTLGGWEAKTSREFTPWDEVPAYYQCQAQTYMMLSGLSRWWFTVGFAGWQVRHYIVEADTEDQALIAERTEAFWKLVETQTPPDTDGSEATTAALTAAYGRIPDADDTLYADSDLERLVSELRFWRGESKLAEARVSEIENNVKARMQDRAVLVDAAGSPLVTWKPSVSRRVDLDLLRADHPEVAAACTTESVTRRFLVKTVKGND